METRPDLDLVLARARAGDEAALEGLDAALRPRLAEYVRRQMGERARRWADAEELVERALCEHLPRLADLPEGAGADELLRRLYQTARNRVRDSVRNHRRLVGESAAGAAGTLPRAGMTGQPSDGTVTRQDTRRWVRELVERLPAKYRDVVRLCALEELSYVEAAHRLGLQPDAVRKRYEAARDALSRRIAARDGRGRRDG